MNEVFTLAVLCGGLSEEAEISRVSGKAVHQALSQTCHAELFDLSEDAMPEGLRPDKHIIFPAMHGGFGENGALQEILEKAGFAFAGSGADASRLCMDKVAAKRRVAEVQLPVAPDIVFSQRTKPNANSILNTLGKAIVIKPQDKGSSVGLYLIDSAEGLHESLASLPEGNWMAEPRLEGRELTVGLLDGQAMAVVEIIPDSGVYDFEHKYSKGRTTYRCPAELPESLTKELQRLAEQAYSACGCRDFARVDFILCSEDCPVFLEVNTIPGLTETSLLPKSAASVGLDFQTLAQRMIRPAIHRFNQINLNVNTLH